MEKILNIAKSLSDGNRLRALMLLRGGELCVCQLITFLELAPSTVSKHMSILKQASLVKTRREGKWTYYKLSRDSSDPAISEILDWVEKNIGATETIATDKNNLLKTLRYENMQCNKIETTEVHEHE